MVRREEVSQPSEPMVCPGLFYAVPAQDGIILRVRTPGGLLSSQQSTVVAHFAAQHGDGYIQITHRANLQIRAACTVPPATMLSMLQAAGLASHSAAVDHLRNILASPTAGIDPHALIDTRPLVAALDGTIAQHEEFARLPAKFSVGFDGGEAVSVRDRRNDLWFVATAGRQPREGGDRPVSFRLVLHCGQGWELDTGILLRPEDCVPVVIKVAQAYLAHVDRWRCHAAGKKPRVGHVFAQQGMAWFREHVGQSLPFAVQDHPGAMERSAVRPPPYRHIGLHPQRQPGFSYFGVVLPLGRLSAQQLQALAHLADVTAVARYDSPPGKTCSFLMSLTRKCQHSTKPLPSLVYMGRRRIPGVR
jgi:ferredoxin-nitrite reductase